MISPAFVVHAEICEDVWIPVPPSSEAALAGATVLANLSASNITIGKAETRRLLCRSQSARCVAAYLYAAAGAGESTTDLAWDGQASIFENGATLAETERFPSASQFAIADIDLDLLRHERMQMGSFDTNRRRHPAVFRQCRFPARGAARRYRLRAQDRALPVRAGGCRPARAGLLRGLQHPGVGTGAAAARDRHQARGDRRVRRPRFDAGADRLLRGRSTCSKLPRTNILAYTMPGFATSAHTKANAIRLMEALGVTWHELDIRPAAQRMLADIGHPFSHGEPVYDLTFENVQAGLRTDYLFRLANHHNGIVIGTGDLSELALGWCTYGVGDQMSHYNVNAGVPKTLIQHLIRWVISSRQFEPDVAATLDAILATEITPELVPTNEGETPQSTEAHIGPYALQDFNLYYTLRHGFPPSKIAFLALHAWEDAAKGDWPPGFPPERRSAYDLATIRRWLEVFVRRFFAFSQFKRSAMPNGPKVSAGGSLSPRGDWRAPSDGNANAWLAELERNVPKACSARPSHSS